MMDLRHLRKYTPVVTTSEYLKLNGLNPSLERPNGAWHRHHGPASSLTVIRNDEYDPTGVVRVDKILPAPATVNVNLTGSAVYQKLMEVKGEERVKNLNDVKGPLKDVATWGNDEELETLIEDHGFIVLHTFASALVFPLLALSYLTASILH